MTPQRTRNVVAEREISFGVSMAVRHTDSGMPEIARIVRFCERHFSKVSLFSKMMRLLLQDGGPDRF